METRANFILIGAFTLLAFFGALGLFAWFAKIQIDQQFAYYDIVFDSVSGLDRAAEVEFSGLAVGQVISLDLYDQDPSKVRVRVEVKADTPVRTDTLAQLQSQGVTGLSYVSLKGGSADAPLLRDTDLSGVPVIQAERSVVQALSEDAPNLLAEAISLLEDISEFANDSNRQNVSNILSNLDRVSGNLDTALEDFSAISQTVAKATDQITLFTGKLDEIGGNLNTTLLSADATLGDVRGAVGVASKTLTTAETAMGRMDSVFEGANTLVSDQVPALIDDLSSTVATLDQSILGLREDAGQVMAGFSQSAELANARLAALEATMAQVDATLVETREALGVIRQTSLNVDGLVTGDGTALIGDARATLASVKTSADALAGMVQEDMQQIIADVRAATSTANTVIEQVGRDITTATGKLDPLTIAAEETLQTATGTLRNANGTLSRLETALDVAERTLTAAEGTFTSANTIIETDVAPTAKAIREAADGVAQSVGDVTRDIPEISAELRAAIANAAQIIDRLDRTVQAVSPRVEDFARTGLPAFTDFATEAQDLIDVMERLTNRLERDPARFFFGNQPPEFRR